jgi:chemotaxis protein methyltransferase CheR
VELAPPVFAVLSALIEEKTGLHCRSGDRELLADRLALRARECGFDSLFDYYCYLRYDPDSAVELANLTESLVVGETYFFREFRPLQVLVDEFIEPWCRAGQRPRIWSAACATGEEPLTLAMLLAERGLLPRVEITATDISQRALDRAMRGVHGPRAVRSIPDPALAARYLRSTPTGHEVDPRLIGAIRWRRINLIDPDQVGALGVFDAILCRNVLIYFRDQTVQTVVQQLSGHLAAGGVLLVGISESLLRFGSALVGEELRDVFIYRNAPPHGEDPSTGRR